VLFAARYLPIAAKRHRRRCNGPVHSSREPTFALASFEQIEALPHKGVCEQLVARSRRTLNVIPAGIHQFKNGNAEGSCLSGAILGTRQYVSLNHRERNGSFLDWRRSLEALLVNSSEQIP
jgi:hypothetical protein